jgi:hypothetical protein
MRRRADGGVRPRRRRAPPRAHHDDATAHPQHVDRGTVQRRQPLAGEDVVRRTDGPAAPDEVQHAVDEREHRVDLVGDEQHGGAELTATVVDELGDRLLVLEVEGEQRLVAQQHLGTAQQSLGDP